MLKWDLRESVYESEVSICNLSLEIFLISEFFILAL